MGFFRKLMLPLAELSVVGSYGRGGYRLRSPDFDPADLAVDLRGERHVVTGATSGLGLAAAHALSALGATVVMVGRDAEKLARAVEGVPGAVGERCDLSDLEEVGALAARLGEQPLASLVHNAGFIVPERRLTRQGHESAFATHVLAPFVLSHRLMERLAQAPRTGRLVWVSSGGMYSQKLDLAKAEALHGTYDGVRAYAQHKRAQVLLSESFQRLFEARGLGVASNAMHPGWVDTSGVEVGLPRFYRRMKRWLRTPEAGADTIVWLCARPTPPAAGRFYLDRKARRTEIVPGTRHDDGDRARLWELCARLTGIDVAAP
jgi:NAD(P)-dependent dehydrogenase (short-subunit alcohol dehydrogenase family)